MYGALPVNQVQRYVSAITYINGAGRARAIAVTTAPVLHLPRLRLCEAPQTDATDFTRPGNTLTNHFGGVDDLSFEPIGANRNSSRVSNNVAFWLFLIAQ